MNVSIAQHAAIFVGVFGFCAMCNSHRWHGVWATITALASLCFMSLGVLKIWPDAEHLGRGELALIFSGITLAIVIGCAILVAIYMAFGWWLNKPIRINRKA